MTAEGVVKAADKTEETYDQSSIVLRVVRNVLISQMMTADGAVRGLEDSIIFDSSSRSSAMQSVMPQKFGQSVLLWQQTAKYVQLLCGVLDLLDPLNSSEQLKSLPDEQRQSVEQLYDFCLNQSNHPDELDKLQKQIVAVNACLYKNEGTLFNWSSASSLCGNIRQKLDPLLSQALEVKYSMMVNSAQSYLTRKALSEQEQDVTELLGALSISEKDVDADKKRPEPPPPPPVYTVSFLQATKPIVADDSVLAASGAHTAVQAKKQHSSAMILAQQKKMAAARKERIRLAKQAREKQTDAPKLDGATTDVVISDGDMQKDIERQVAASRQLARERLAAEQRKRMEKTFGGSKFLSLAAMHDDSESEDELGDGLGDSCPEHEAKKKPSLN